MIESDLRCGVNIYDAKRNMFRTCNAKARYVLIIRGDQLFSHCHRHTKRMVRAFPEAALPADPGDHFVRT